MLKVAIFQFSLFGINTYVVWDPESKECAVIDPGMISQNEEKALTDFINKESLKVTDLINTHLHIDHVIGNSYVAKTYGVKTKAHDADAFLGRNVSNQAQSFGLPMNPENVTDTISLKEGDIIKIGTGELSAISVPGHSPGSIVLYDKDDGFIIAGDVIFQGSIGRTDLPGGSYQQLIDGIRNKLLVLPDSTVVYPGHGSPTTIGEEKRSNPFLC